MDRRIRTLAVPTLLVHYLPSRLLVCQLFSPSNLVECVRVFRTTNNPCLCYFLLAVLVSFLVFSFSLAVFSFALAFSSVVASLLFPRHCVHIHWTACVSLTCHSRRRFPLSSSHQIISDSCSYFCSIVELFSIDQQV